MRKQLAEEHRKQREEKEASSKNLDHINSIDEKFFSRFGSSIR